MRSNHDRDEVHAARAILAEFRRRAAAPNHRHDVPSIPDDRDQERDRQITRREILHQQKKPVAFDVIGLERRRAAGAVRVVMVDDRAGRIPALPSRPSRSQAEIGVLAVEKEILIETAQLF